MLRNRWNAHVHMHVHVCPDTWNAHVHVRGEVRLNLYGILIMLVGVFSEHMKCSNTCVGKYSETHGILTYMGMLTNMHIHREMHNTITILKRTSTLLWFNAGLGLFLEEKRREDNSSSFISRTSTTDNMKVHVLWGGRRHSKLMLPTC